jgi:hypothetical protein
MAYESNTWRIKNGLYAALECERGSQVDLEGERLGHWRVSPPSFLNDSS